MTDWPAIHHDVLEKFAKGWRDPRPHAWDDLVTEDVELTQPLLRDGVGGAPLTFRLCDKLTLNPTGHVVRREAFFDPGPVALTLLRRPAAWWPWWRSGVGPLLARRQFLRGQRR